MLSKATPLRPQKGEGGGPRIVLSLTLISAHFLLVIVLNHLICRAVILVVDSSTIESEGKYIAQYAISSSLFAL